MLLELDDRVAENPECEVNNEHLLLCVDEMCGAAATPVCRYSCLSVDLAQNGCLYGDRLWK